MNYRSNKLKPKQFFQQNIITRKNINYKLQMIDESKISEGIDQQINVHFGKFTIFLLAKTAQNSYGIKNSDYQRYRRYCAKKIQKLRKSMGVKYGTKTKFIKKDVIKQKHNDSKILQIALFNVQKNWALSNQTKFSVSRKPSQKSRGRFASIKKLRKALQWSKKLSNICNQKTDSVTKLQANAYQLYVQGLLQFERQNWNEAQIKLIACRQIIQDLMKVSDSMTQKIFKQKTDQIEQTIKFCNFKISKGKDMPISEIIEMKKVGDANLSSLIESLTQRRLAEVSLEQNKGNNQIRFDEERYPIKEEKIIIQKSKIDSELNTLQQIKQKSLSKLDDDQLYEELLTFYSSVVLQIQDAIKMTDSERQDGKKNEKYTQGELQILKKVSILFQQIKMQVFIDRNYTIFKHSFGSDKGRKSSPQTLTKLLTATINLFTNLSELIKQKAAISGTLQLEQIKETDQKAFYLRTLRLMFVGQVYLNNDKVRQAYSLWGECERCVKILQSKQQMKNQKQKKQQENDKLKCNLVQLSKISQTVKQNRIKCIINNYNIQKQSSSQLNKMVNQIKIDQNSEQKLIQVTLEDLINSSTGQNQISLQKMSQINIIQLPGQLQPMPTRPIFFDIYQTHIQYPDLSKKAKKGEKVKSWWNIFK